MFETIRNVLAKQFELDPETITRDTNLIDDIGADSLDVVELIMALEDEFGIEFTPSPEITTVGKLVEAVEKLTNED